MNNVTMQSFFKRYFSATERLPGWVGALLSAEQRYCLLNDIMQWQPAHCVGENSLPGADNRSASDRVQAGDL